MTRPCPEGPEDEREMDDERRYSPRSTTSHRSSPVLTTFHHSHRRSNMGRIGLLFLLVIAAIVAGTCSLIDADDPRLADPAVASEQLVQSSIQSPFVLAVAIVLAVAAAYVGYQIYQDRRAMLDERSTR